MKREPVASYKYRRAMFSPLPFSPEEAEAIQKYLDRENGVGMSRPRRFIRHYARVDPYNGLGKFSVRVYWRNKEIIWDPIEHWINQPKPDRYTVYGPRFRIAYNSYRTRQFIVTIWLSKYRICIAKVKR